MHEKITILINNPHGPITIIIEQAPPPLWYWIAIGMIVAVAVCWFCLLVRDGV